MHIEAEIADRKGQVRIGMTSRLIYSIFRPGKNTRVGPGSRFSAAESEFIRLFEDHNGVFDSFRHDSGASSVDALTDGDANIKMEDFLQTLGFSGFNADIFDSDGGNTDEGENFNKSLLSKLGKIGGK